MCLSVGVQVWVHSGAGRLAGKPCRPTPRRPSRGPTPLRAAGCSTAQHSMHSTCSTHPHGRTYTPRTVRHRVLLGKLKRALHRQHIHAVALRGQLTGRGGGERKGLCCGTAPPAAQVPARHARGSHPAGPHRHAAAPRPHVHAGHVVAAGVKGGRLGGAPLRGAHAYRQGVGGRVGGGAAPRRQAVPSWSVPGPGPAPAVVRGCRAPHRSGCSRTQRCRAGPTGLPC